TLAQSAPHNVTSEMGLALLDVADVIRPHPDVVSFLRDVHDDGFLDELPKLPGGRAARDATAVERTPHHARARDPRRHQHLRAGRRHAALRARAAGGAKARTGPAGAP